MSAKFWMSASFILAIAIGVVVQQNILLREQTHDLRRIVLAQEKWCENLNRVNAVCEDVIKETLVQLGLDAYVVKTSIWQRARKLAPRPAASYGIGGPK